MTERNVLLPIDGAEVFKPHTDWGFGFLVEIDDKSEHTVTFRVRQINGCAADNPNDVWVEDYLTAYIKWDSCCHFYFGDAENGDDREKRKHEGYLHLCGVRDLQAHAALIARLYRKAFEVMGSGPEKGEEWPEG